MNDNLGVGKIARATAQKPESRRNSRGSVQLPLPQMYRGAGSVFNPPIGPKVFLVRDKQQILVPSGRPRQFSPRCRWCKSTSLNAFHRRRCNWMIGYLPKIRGLGLLQRGKRWSAGPALLPSEQPASCSGSTGTIFFRVQNLCCLGHGNCTPQEIRMTSALVLAACWESPKRITPRNSATSWISAPGNCAPRMTAFSCFLSAKNLLPPAAQTGLRHCAARPGFLQHRAMLKRYRYEPAESTKGELTQNKPRFFELPGAGLKF